MNVDTNITTIIYKCVKIYKKWKKQNMTINDKKIQHIAI